MDGQAAVYGRYGWQTRYIVYGLMLLYTPLDFQPYLERTDKL